MDKEYIVSEVNRVEQEIIDIRRQFHMYPELSEHEDETSKFIFEYLEKLGLKPEFIAGRAVVATVYGEGPEKKEVTVGIRADFDALPIQEETNLPFQSKVPGVMHACGHDMHAASLLGTAKVFAENKDKLNGNVKFFFQPQEETVGGAEPMVKAGCMENPHVDYTLGTHIDPMTPINKMVLARGPMNAAISDFVITVKGTSCHGAYPHQGVDPFMITANILLALQTVVSRNMQPTKSMVITIGSVHGGSQNNILPTYVTLEGTLRILSEEDREFGKKRIREVCESIAKAYGGSVEVKIDDLFPPLTNNIQVADLAIGVFKEFFGEDSVNVMDCPTMGGDDFAFFSERVPSCYMEVGACGASQPGEAYGLHSEFMVADERELRNAMILEIGTALKLIEERP